LAKASGEALLDSSSTSWQVCNFPLHESPSELTDPAVFGLPGYFLKGIERELLKRHLTAVQAEIFLIQLRRSSLEFRRSSEDERAEVVEKWKVLEARISQHGRK
jgi:hypothetical protein